MSLRYGQEFLTHRARGTTWAIGGASPEPEASFFAADFSQTNPANVASIWEMSGNAAPQFGVRWTWTHRPGIGPAGEDAWEIQHLYQAVEEQYYVGWDHFDPFTGVDGGSIEGPAYGSDWYVRVLLRVTSDTNWRVPADSSYACKFAIHGDGGGGWLGDSVPVPPDPAHRTRSRVIFSIFGDRTTPSLYQISVHVDAAWGPNVGYTVPRGEWIWLQYAMESSSSVTGPNPTDASMDGAIKIWTTSATYASPDAATTSARLASKGWDPDDIGWALTKLGAFSNETLDSDGIVKFQIAKFEIGTTFDPTWVA